MINVVQWNLMDREGYTPYCGYEGKCSGHWPRMVWVDRLEQFKCYHCGYTTEFKNDFIERYKRKWKL
jgi:hypothetical protein